MVEGEAEEEAVVEPIGDVWREVVANRQLQTHCSIETNQAALVHDSLDMAGMDRVEADDRQVVCHCLERSPK